jgi:hypothetical protein
MSDPHPPKAPAPRWIANLPLAERVAGGVLLATLLWLMVVLCGNAGALWRDEVGSANLAQLPTWGEMWGSVAADSFPPFFNTVLRIWIMIGGTSDDWFHYWGFVPVLGIVFALAWSTRGSAEKLRVPLLSGALLLFNPTMFYWGTSLRAYGAAALLVILLFGTVWRVVERPTPFLVGLGAILSICNAQATYQNATPVFAICVSGAIVAVLRRRWLHAGLALGIGLAGALSLLIHYRAIQEVGEWNILIRSDLAASWFVARAADAFGSGGWPFLWLWGALVLGVGGLVWWQRTRATGAAGEREEFRTTLFSFTSIGIASVVMLLFNTHVGYPTQEWYYIPYVALAATAVEFSLSTLLADGRIRLVRLVLAAIVALTCLSTLWERAQVRRTNIDLVAERLRAEATPRDLILVYPFYCGMAFDYYYKGSVPWQTIPPMGHKETYNSYKYLKPHVLTNEPMRPVIEQIGNVLRGGGRIFFVGGVRLPPEGTLPPASPPAPHPQFGWSDEMYNQIWGLQIGYFLKQHAAKATVHEIKTEQPVQRFENLPLVEISGWRP